MNTSEHLAIASVPIQTWGQLYSEVESLKNGTIFQELDKPFFITEQTKSLSNQTIPPSSFTESENCNCMLHQIQQVSFVVDDLRLYLDTHSNDKEALHLMKNMIHKRKQLLKDFALKHYPLTMDCMADIYAANLDSECYCWQEGPAPWEGVCV